MAARPLHLAAGMAARPLHLAAGMAARPLHLAAARSPATVGKPSERPRPTVLIQAARCL
jgi:hypothetical protein